MDRSILIVLTGSLGDVVRGLPLATIVKRGLPGGRLGWVVEEAWRDLLALHPAIDDVFVFERRRPISSAAGLWGALRAVGWDASLDLQRILKSGVIARMSGARRRIGFPREESKEGNHLFQTEWIRAAENVHKMERYLEFARCLGIEVEPARPLGFGLGGIAPAWGIVGRPRPLVTLVLGSAWPAKDWPAANAVDLARRIVDRSSTDLVLVGHGRQRSTAATIKAAVEAPRVIDLVGRTSLVELAGVLRASAAAAGPDSGPGHLAAALGTPYVGLFGPTDPQRVAPYGCEALCVVPPQPCDGCSRRRCRRSAGDSCMASITAESVYARLELAMRGARGSDSAGR